MFSREAAALNPDAEYPIEFHRIGGKVGVFVAPLIAASLGCGDMDSGDRQRLYNFNPSGKEIEEDRAREHHVYERDGGSCQRSIELFVPLKDKSPSGHDCVQWDQMLDLGLAACSPGGILVRWLGACHEV